MTQFVTRFAVEQSERAAWGVIYRRARRAGASSVDALERADAFVLCQRGRAHEVPGRLRQLELAGMGHRR